MPTETPTDPKHYLLSTVRQSQAAAIDTIRTWTAITEQLTGTFRLPVADFDLTGMVDRAFDVAEQALAAQHQLARTLAGVATRQVDRAVEAVETVAERVSEVEDLAPETPEPAARQDRRFDGRTYEERTVEELRDRAGELQIEGRSSMTKDELIAALRDHRQRRSPKQDRTPDRRAYEERTVEELRERARELEIEGRASMSKDELVAALRQQAK